MLELEKDEKEVGIGPCFKKLSLNARWTIRIGTIRVGRLKETFS